MNLYLLVKEIEVEFEGIDTFPLSVSHDVETLKNSVKTKSEWEKSHSDYISEEDDGFGIIRYKISEIPLI